MQTEIMNTTPGNWPYPLRSSKQMRMAVGVVVSTSHPMPCVWLEWWPRHSRESDSAVMHRCCTVRCAPLKSCCHDNGIKSSSGSINQHHGPQCQVIFSVQTIILDQTMSYPLWTIVKLNPSVFFRMFCSYHHITSLVVKPFLCNPCDWCWKHTASDIYDNRGVSWLSCSWGWVKMFDFCFWICEKFCV